MIAKSLPVLLCFLTHASLVSSSSSSDLDHGLLIEWLTSLDGGYFNPKQDIRREDPNDPTSKFGIFAKELIEEGDLLSEVPWEAIISSEGGEFEYDDDDETALSCGTARNVAREMRLGADNSKYGPYIGYLLAQREGEIPSAWSKEGQNLLLDVLDGKSNQEVPVVLPVDAFGWRTLSEKCHSDKNNVLSARAAMLVVQLADDDIMVPVYDLYNHRNGDWYNTKDEIHDGVKHEMRARRTIQPGEQLYNSYNMCDECGERSSEGYGTPGTYE
jgi:hypothetical protein